MAKKRGGKFPKAFRQVAGARLKQCDTIVELSKELGVPRRLGYTWRDQLEAGEAGEGPPPNSHEVTLRKEVSRVKRAVVDKTLEADFFIGALREVKARRQRSGDSGGTSSTPTSEA